MSPRLRARFTKTGKVRFVSHRDLARIWERALRRAGVPVAYTEGFSPRPKLSFGLALSTGYESLGEYLDISVRDGAQPDVDIEQLPTLLTGVLPVGIEVQAVVGLEHRVESLQQGVTSCTWHIELTGADAAAVSAAVDDALAAGELVISRTRKGHEAVEDIRSGIVTARVLGPAPSGATVVEAELATQPRGLRPAELVRALDPANRPRSGPAREGARSELWSIEVRRVVRIHQWTHVGGARQEVIPLPSAATLARTQQARAS
ncbi:MAG: TIGR03936 family radical SAM-associated protein [Acidimicrobiales bacterium]